jgi:hypothetical protein
MENRASLAIYLHRLLVSDSHWVGLNFAGMMELPARSRDEQLADAAPRPLATTSVVAIFMRSAARA